MKFTKSIITSSLLFFFITVISAKTQSNTDTTKVHHKKSDKENCCSQKMSSHKDKMNHEKKECSNDSGSCCKTDEKKSEGTNTGALKTWNKVCPVQGEEVDSEAPTTEYKGKLIGFCCPGCDKKFQKDPERYMKNLSDDGTTFVKN